MEQPVYGQPYQNYNYRVFNWGFKMTLNATAITQSDVFVGENQLMNESYKNNSGFGLYTFFRVNLDRVFIQPEFGWSRISKELFMAPTEVPDPKLTDLSLKIETANVNALAGYNITKTVPFVFNVIAGASFRYKFDSHYSNSDFDFHDRRGRYNTYGVVGFTTNISYIHFDVRYEMSLFHTDIRFDDIADCPEEFAGIYVRKSENIISFACGFMF
ncbi:hypothetical protein FACS189440_18160 [Bacteroidia bacterium]|nr:hypothetical protein FACS189423_08110 [Bacteroidia bacterium]GHT50549.1 hypothetical protein FACS189440_18160 [Bacteroidia bacterium]